MAFEKNQPTRAKNQFAARLTSNKTGNTVSWVHPTDDFARKVCGVNNASEMTFAQAEQFLPDIHNNEKYTLVLTDTMAEREVIEASDF